MQRPYGKDFTKKITPVLNDNGEINQEHGKKLIREEKEKMRYDAQWGSSWTTDYSKQKIDAMRKAYKITKIFL